MKGYVNEDGLFCMECPYCKKVICGLTVKQVSYNMKIHILYCKKRKQLIASGLHKNDTT